jgi:ethanolamine utilization microcompartment shell protein EutS
MINDSRFDIKGGVPMEKRAILVTGSRAITSYKIVALILDRFNIAKIIVGDASGVDELAENYAKTHGILERFIVRFIGKLIAILKS